MASAMRDFWKNVVGTEPGMGAGVSVAPSTTGGKPLSPEEEARIHKVLDAMERRVAELMVEHNVHV